MVAETRPTAARGFRANADVAERLDEVADLLAEQHANPFRVQAYRRAAWVIRGLERDVARLCGEGGVEALDALPGIGESLARSIRDLVVYGRLTLLDRLRGETDPIRLLRTVPGVGRRLAEMFHHKLGIDSLEELEVAANDGTLEVFGGIGAKRLEGIRAALAARLQSRRALADAAPPSVAELLDVDREYREKAAAGTLRRIAPRRMNPQGEAWLPVLHTRRGEREYTALFSNTPHAHRLGTTHDWVILTSDHDGGGRERQATVITARFGPLKGQRIVRGREDECLRLARRKEWDRAIGSDPERGPGDSPPTVAPSRWH